LAPRSDVSEPPPPPLSSPTFRFTSLSSDRVFYGWDLLEALGGSSFQRTLSLLLARLFLSNGRRDLLRPLMFGGHQVWGLLPVRDSINYPIFGVDLSKLFFLKSPHHTRIAWHLLQWPIRFDFLVVCLAEIKAPNLLLFRTSFVVVALVIFWIVVKFCVVWCYCCCVVCSCCFCVVVVVIFVVVKFGVVFLLYCFAVLFVGYWAVTNVIFTALYVGFCLPLCRVVGPYCIIF
jgi:hypothetical protein